MTKKLFSIVLSMFLLITFMPVGVQAARVILTPEENINKLQTLKKYLVKEEKVSNINLNNILTYIYDGKLAELIIGAYKASKSNSNKLYIYHDLYRDKDSFYRYKEVFKFYKNSDKTGYIETKTNIRIEANR